MIKYFKILALLEGLSAIVLFLFAMPMKYIFGNSSFVPPIGKLHGVLFTAYFVVSVYLFYQQKWSFKKWAIVVIGSIVPGGTFYVDKKYL